ncbi:MAG: CRISPR-associated endonuclease Cas2 [Deltaproteobacteria bacterium]|nr:CRISPR-associated endonuclease Cas2 [Deltaproteobacteria bacterium]
MKNFGELVQKSVFECRIDDQQFLRMKQTLDKIMNMNEDSVRYYVGRNDLMNKGLR